MKDNMKKLYESKINDLSNELITCMCKLEGKIEKMPFTTPQVVKYSFIYEGKALFSIINNNEWYKIKVFDNKDCIILKVKKNNLDIMNVYNIMERKYEDEGEYSELIKPIDKMIETLTSHTNKC